MTTLYPLYTSPNSLQNDHTRHIPDAKWFGTFPNHDARQVLRIANLRDQYMPYLQKFVHAKPLQGQYNNLRTIASVLSHLPPTASKEWPLTGTFSHTELFQKLSKTKNTLQTNKLHIDLEAVTEEKVSCQLVYRTDLGKVVTTQGVIRAIFLQAGTDQVAILENGLSIPTRNLLHIRRMEG